MNTPKDGPDPDPLIAALTDENRLLGRRLERERRIRRDAEQIAEQGLRDLYQRQMGLETLAGLAQRLFAALTPRDIAAALSEQVLDAAGASTLGLGLVHPGRHDLDWIGVPGSPQEMSVAPIGQEVSAEVLRSGRPAGARAATDDPSGVHWLPASGSESTVGWPLTAGGEPLGVLLLVWAEPQPLDTAGRSFISAVATMVSQALVRARIYSDEHARASVLQSAVLPASPAQTPGLEVCITYEPADASHGVGGDWYDVMPLPGGRVYLAVGDVVGHGLPAVQDMVQLRGAGRALAHHGSPPAKLLAQLNAFTLDASHGKFATMAVAIFDQNDGSLSYATAGHPPPLFRRSATGEVSRLSDAHGLVLGPVREATYTEGRLRAEPGDILVMYTDGLVEGIDANIESGIAGAERLVAAWNPDVEVSRNCGLLRERLSTRSGSDDVCAAVVRFTAASTTGESPPLRVYAAAP